MTYGKMNRHKGRRPKGHRARAIRKDIVRVVALYGAGCAEDKFMQRQLKNRLGEKPHTWGKARKLRWGWKAPKRRPKSYIGG